MVGHVNRARCRQCRVVFDHTPNGHAVQLAGGSSFIETGLRTVKNNTQHIASGIADLGNHVVGLGDTDGVSPAGHQHHVRLQAVGDVR